MFGSFEPFFEDQRAESAFIHESSYVDKPCRIGENTTILHFAHVMANTIIGNYCLIGHNVTIASGVYIGDNVRVMNHSLLNPGVIMENDVYCGPNTVFTENRHVRANTKNISRVSPTLVRQGAQIGPNTTVASGFTIGRFSFIEASTVVDRNIPDFAVVYGNPLKVAGWRCECGQALKQGTQEEIRCTYCNRQYLRQSKWRVLQLTREGEIIAAETYATDTHPQFDPSVRSAQKPD
jgi:UDP-2-acetamido-3-amino-2,3-dideoxy-glucuronate N-acetyltransferase